MIDLVEGVSLGGSLLLIGVVITLVRRRALAEEYALAWLLIGAGMLVVSVRRQILHELAQRLGIHYPPALLLLALLAFGTGSALLFSVVASRQRRQIERLMEDTALLDARLRELTARAEPQSSEPNRPRA